LVEDGATVKKARTDIVLVLVFFYLLTLGLLQIGFEPSRHEVAGLIALVAAVVVLILFRAGRADPKR
jgi:hypothetical protein